jgi:plasmid stabilization system protein ParE
MSEDAQVQADAAYRWLGERTTNAAAWFNGLLDAIEGLAELPTRWPLARESAKFDEPVRQLLYGKSPHAYRVLFIVRSQVVHVLHIRHGARDALQRGDLSFPPYSE